MKTVFGNTTRTALLTAFLFSALALGGCATVKSGSHHDESASFTQYKTFSWMADRPLIVGSGQSAPISPLTEKKIADAIAGELTRKGFVFLTDRDAADFVVSFTVGTRERIEVDSYPVAYRGFWGGRLYGRNYYDIGVEHRMYTEGTLGVDVFDGKSKQPVWHGWATKLIETSDRNNPAPAIDKAVTAIFETFPPGAARN